MEIAAMQESYEQFTIIFEFCQVRSERVEQRYNGRDEAAQTIPIPALSAPPLYATVPRRYFDVQNIKRAPTAEHPEGTAVALQEGNAINAVECE